jgi:hypothetical protein
MTPPEREAALARCDAEIARIEQEGATGKHPAWLLALGMNDWQMEKRAIEREDANA